MPTTYREDSDQESKTTSDESDDGTPEFERSGDDDDVAHTDDEDNHNALPDTPMSGWEEFDQDAVYQKKLVNPEMRQWVLTKDCRRIISDRFFNNPVRDEGICNPFLKKRADGITYSAPVRPVLRQLYTKK